MYSAKEAKVVTPNLVEGYLHDFFGASINEFYHLANAGDFVGYPGRGGNAHAASRYCPLLGLECLFEYQKRKETAERAVGTCSHLLVMNLLVGVVERIEARRKCPRAIPLGYAQRKACHAVGGMLKEGVNDGLAQNIYLISPFFC